VLFRSGAPAGARITPAGRFTWTPQRNQAPGTNVVTVRVTDDGTPALSDTKSFTIVVGDFLELSLGSTVVAAGSSGTVGITVSSLTPVTNVNFVLSVPVAGVTNFSLATPAPPVARATLARLSSTQYQIDLQAVSGQPFVGSQAVSSLQFEGMTTEPSAFIPLNISSLVAIQPNGVALGRTLGNDGRVEFVADQPRLEAQLVGSTRQLILYAQPGQTNSILCTTNLNPPIVWTPIWSDVITNLKQTLTLPATNVNTFYRMSRP